MLEVNAFNLTRMTGHPIPDPPSPQISLKNRVNRTYPFSLDFGCWGRGGLAKGPWNNYLDLRSQLKQIGFRAFGYDQS